MDPIRNPYTPNAGERPDVLAGRDGQIEQYNVLLQRVSRGRSARSMIITGLRGVGKTVLLGKFRDTSLEAGWTVIEHEAAKHNDNAFRREMGLRLRTALFDLSPRARWTERYHRAAAAISAFSVTIDASGQVKAGLDLTDPVEGLADHGDLPMDMTDVLVALGAAAQEKSSGIALLLDEIQFLSRSQLESLIMALHKTVQRALPVVLVGAGLPQVPELAGDAKSYAERLFTFPVIGSLSGTDAHEALSGPAAAEQVRIDDDALARAFEVTGGYPYFIQELGSAAWSKAEHSPISLDDINDAAELYLAKLDESFFRVRLDRTTELQTAYLRAMAELGPQPHRASEVAVLLGRESTQLGPTRAELIDMGLLYTPQRGLAAFTVPHFDQFMLRAVPELLVPQVRRRRR
ncbi:MAG: ATP-binding protein [Cellulomonadaceae bacterium]|nr:ATP-binding protein [Cellulomonadaceae bacterium]